MVRLCQRETASCGACCGLYNRAALSREVAEVALERRTRALEDVPRTVEAFRAAARSLAREEAAVVFESVRVCLLLGWVDRASRRLGCLGHPAVTGGVDLRSCGAYDVLTCDAFLCASHARLSEEEAALVEGATAGDPYLYGLVAPDAAFARAALSAIAVRVGQDLCAADLDHPPFRAALAGLLGLKELLEPGSEGLFAAFHPAKSAPPQGAAPLGDQGADAIAAALGADARSGNDEDALEAEAARRLEECVRTFPGRRER